MPRLVEIQEPFAEYCDAEQAIYWLAYDIRPTTAELRSAQARPPINTEAVLEHCRALYRAVVTGALPLYGKRCQDGGARRAESGGRVVYLTMPGALDPISLIPPEVCASATFDGIDWHYGWLTYRDDPFDEQEHLYTNLQFKVGDLLALTNGTNGASPHGLDMSQAPRVALINRAFVELAKGGQSWSAENAEALLEELDPSTSPTERKDMARMLVHERHLTPQKKRQQRHPKPLSRVPAKKQ